MWRRGALRRPRHARSVRETLSLGRNALAGDDVVFQLGRVGFRDCSVSLIAGSVVLTRDRIMLTRGSGVLLDGSGMRTAAAIGSSVAAS